MSQLIKNGHVYASVGPLFKINYGNDKHKYVQSNEERDKFLKTISGNYMVTRFKGLMASPETE